MPPGDPLSFEADQSLIFGDEGGYSCDPSDAGNWTGGAVGAGTLRGTKYGISAAAFPTLDIAALTRAQAAAIYRARYWDRIGGDSLPAPLALLLFDCAVNQGVGAAARILQASLGVTTDGVIGPVTLAAVARADQASLLVDVTARRALRYAETGALVVFGLGWMRRLTRTARLAFLAQGATP